MDSLSPLPAPLAPRVSDDSHTQVNSIELTIDQILKLNDEQAREYMDKYLLIDQNSLRGNQEQLIRRLVDKDRKRTRAQMMEEFKSDDSFEEWSRKHRSSGKAPTDEVCIHPTDTICMANALVHSSLITDESHHRVLVILHDFRARFAKYLQFCSIIIYSTGYRSYLHRSCAYRLHNRVDQPRTTTNEPSHGGDLCRHQLVYNTSFFIGKRCQITCRLCNDPETRRQLGWSSDLHNTSCLAPSGVIPTHESTTYSHIRVNTRSIITISLDCRNNQTSVSITWKTQSRQSRGTTLNRLRIANARRRHSCNRCTLVCTNYVLTRTSRVWSSRNRSSMMVSSCLHCSYLVRNTSNTNRSDYRPPNVPINTKNSYIWCLVTWFVTQHQVLNRW
jgi:hypothetical protein